MQPGARGLSPLEVHDGREVARRATRRRPAARLHHRQARAQLDGEGPRGAAGVHHRLPQGRAGGGAAAGGVRRDRTGAAERLFAAPVAIYAR